MEEILASIRKIIADEDTAPEAVAAEPARLREATDPRPATVVTSITPQAFAARSQGPTVFGLSRPPSAPVTPQQEPLPIATQVVERAAIERAPHVAEAPPAARAQPAVPTVAEPESEQPATIAPADLRPVSDPGTLVSPIAGGSVAAAFQALATSVALTNSEMIERHVRDLLRPMLRSWLDDNLPVIVEKLVRTEIERVARGGR